MGLVYIVLSCVYAGLIIISALVKSKFKIYKLLFILGGIFMLLSNIGIVMNNILYILCAIAGLLFINAAAILNGYKLFGKPHWKHHIIRAIISFILVLLFVFNFYL